MLEITPKTRNNTLNDFLNYAEENLEAAEKVRKEAVKNVQNASEKLKKVKKEYPDDEIGKLEAEFELTEAEKSLKKANEEFENRKHILGGLKLHVKDVENVNKLLKHIYSTFEEKGITDKITGTKINFVPGPSGGVQYYFSGRYIEFEPAVVEWVNGKRTGLKECLVSMPNVMYEAKNFSDLATLKNALKIFSASDKIFGEYYGFETRRKEIKVTAFEKKEVIESIVIFQRGTHYKLI